jgi:hypothetical protein
VCTQTASRLCEFLELGPAAGARLPLVPRGSHCIGMGGETVRVARGEFGNGHRDERREPRISQTALAFSEIPKKKKKKKKKPNKTVSNGELLPWR